MSRVSVIIPTYNRGNLIEETLESLFRQTRPADEIIVVDDGSTDDTVERLAAYGDRLCVIRQENAGPASARNLGLKVATGDIIQFFDSDDLMASNKIETQVAALDNTDADIVYCPWVKADLADGVAKCAQKVLQQRALPNVRPPIRHFLHGWVTVFQTCLFRRALFERVGNFDTRLMPSEDSELMFRLLFKGARLAHTPETIVLYRLHASQQISGSGLNELRRVRDWALYKEIVWNWIGPDSNNFSYFDRMIWQHDLFEAQRELATLDKSISVEREAVIPRLLATAYKLHRRLLRKLTNVKASPAYGEAPLTVDQRALLADLGYAVRF